jgi:hypothetical protein
MAVQVGYALVRADSGLYTWLYNQCFSEYIGEYSLGNGVEFFAKSNAALSRACLELENNPSLSKAIITFEFDDSENITILAGVNLQIKHIKKGSIFDNDTTPRLIQKHINVDATPSALEYFKQLYKGSYLYLRNPKSNTYTPSHSNGVMHATHAASAITSNIDMKRSPTQYRLE